MQVSVYQYIRNNIPVDNMLSAVNKWDILASVELILHSINRLVIVIDLI